MAFVFSMSDPLIIYGIIGGIGVVLALVAALYLKRKLGAVSQDGKNPGSKAGRLAYQPEARPVPIVSQSAIPRPAKKTPSRPLPKEVSLTDGRKDISESLKALAEKYSLDQFTIATSDGLVFASSGGDDAQNDAALYGEIYINDPLSETPGAVLTSISHKGSDLILIIRTTMPVSEVISNGIENDTKDILNWWI
ncbi:MAG: hypothetical protein M0Q92_04420 [Methanoregula sp.]|jgi:hypothetical protein|nr:hypothetical protein [Methanoregula sp.]